MVRIRRLAEHLSDLPNAFAEQKIGDARIHMRHVVTDEFDVGPSVQWLP